MLFFLLLLVPQLMVQLGSDSQGNVLDEKAPVLVFNDENSEEQSKGIIVSTLMTKSEVIESAMRKFRLEGDPNEYVFIEVTEKGQLCLSFFFNFFFLLFSSFCHLSNGHQLLFHR